MLRFSKAGEKTKKEKAGIPSTKEGSRSSKNVAAQKDSYASSPTISVESAYILFFGGSDS